MAGSGGGGGSSGTVDYPGYMKDLHREMYAKIKWNVECAEFQDFPYGLFDITSPWEMIREMAGAIDWFSEELNNYEAAPLWAKLAREVIDFSNNYPILFPSGEGYDTVYNPATTTFSITPTTTNAITLVTKPTEVDVSIDEPYVSDPFFDLEEIIEKLRPDKYTPTVTHPNIDKPTSSNELEEDTNTKPNLSIQLNLPDIPEPECGGRCTPTIDIDWQDFEIDLAPINDMMAAELEKLRSQMYDDILPKYRRGMQNIGAVTVSSYKIGEALLWAEYLKRVNEVSPKYQNMIQQMLLDKYKSLMQAKTQVGIAQANLEMEAYKTDIDVWKTKRGEQLQAESLKLNALLEKYKAEVDLYKTDKQIDTQTKLAVMQADLSVYQTEVDMYKADLNSETQIDIALLNNQTQTYKIDADIFNTQVGGGTASVSGQAAKFSALATVFGAKMSSQTQVAVAKLQAKTSIYNTKADMYKTDVSSKTQILNSLNQIDLEAKKAKLSAEVDKMKSSTQREVQIIDTSSRNKFEQAKLFERHIFGLLDREINKLNYEKDVKDSEILVAKTRYAMEKEYDDAMNALHLDAARWRLEINKYLMDALGCISGSAGVSYTTASQSSRLGSVVSGALGMGATGVAAGSFAGPEGMAIGGAAGAIIGALGGLFA